MGTTRHTDYSGDVFGSIPSFDAAAEKIREEYLRIMAANPKTERATALMSADRIVSGLGALGLGSDQETSSADPSETA